MSSAIKKVAIKIPLENVIAVETVDARKWVVEDGCYGTMELLIAIPGRDETSRAFTCSHGWERSKQMGYLMILRPE